MSGPRDIDTLLADIKAAVAGHGMLCRAVSLRIIIDHPAKVVVRGEELQATADSQHDMELLVLCAEPGRYIDDAIRPYVEALQQKNAELVREAAR